MFLFLWKILCSYFFHWASIKYIILILKTFLIFLIYLSLISKLSLLLLPYSFMFFLLNLISKIFLRFLRNCIDYSLTAVETYFQNSSCFSDLFRWCVFLELISESVLCFWRILLIILLLFSLIFQTSFDVLI